MCLCTSPFFVVEYVVINERRSEMYKERVNRVAAEMDKAGISQLLVTDPDSIRYLTDIYNHPMERFWGFLIRKDGGNVLFANRLFRLGPVDAEVVLFDDTDPVAGVVCPYLAEGTLGVDSTMTARFLLPFMSRMPGLRPVLADACVNDVRACKDEEEQRRMIESSEINDRAMEKLMGFIRDGVTEKECAEFIMKCYAEEGCPGNAFTPIVSFGANAADPHHHADGTVLKDGDCILVDTGCVWKSYCSDMTRTFYWKYVSEEDERIYNICRDANLLAEAEVRPGRMFKEIDLTARKHIESFGYGPNFIHRLGHSIGLADHEGEDVSSVNDHIIKPGMCFSIEPGIYLPGKTGVRVEDLVLVTEDGCRILNSFSKELMILGK